MNQTSRAPSEVPVLPATGLPIDAAHRCTSHTRCSIQTIASAMSLSDHPPAPVRLQAPAPEQFAVGAADLLRNGVGATNHAAV